MATDTKYPKHYKCRLCGCKLTLLRPWHGRPQGPQCQCNPNTWGNWQRVEVGADETAWDVTKHGTGPLSGDY